MISPSRTMATATPGTSKAACAFATRASTADGSKEFSLGDAIVVVRRRQTEADMADNMEQTSSVPGKPQRHRGTEKSTEKTRRRFSLCAFLCASVSLWFVLYFVP